MKIHLNDMNLLKGGRATDSILRRKHRILEEIKLFSIYIYMNWRNGALDNRGFPVINQFKSHSVCRNQHELHAYSILF